jgi:hypothetical protein
MRPRLAFGRGYRVVPKTLEDARSLASATMIMPVAFRRGLLALEVRDRLASESKAQALFWPVGGH